MPCVRAPAPVTWWAGDYALTRHNMKLGGVSCYPAASALLQNNYMHVRNRTVARYSCAARATRTPLSNRASWRVGRLHNRCCDSWALEHQARRSAPGRTDPCRQHSATTNTAVHWPRLGWRPGACLRKTGTTVRSRAQRGAHDVARSTTVHPCAVKPSSVHWLTRTKGGGQLCTRYRIAFGTHPLELRLAGHPSRDEFATTVT